MLRRCPAPGGELLIETYGVADQLAGLAALHVCAADELYARDEFVFWGFSGDSLERLARHAGFAAATVLSTPTVDGHPREVRNSGSTDLVFTRPAMPRPTSGAAHKLTSSTSDGA